MTTVIFDGQRMVADSQITFTTLSDKKKPKLSRQLGFVKIFTTTNLMYKGEKIEAIGIAGDVAIINHLAAMENEAIRLNTMWELSSPEHYKLFPVSTITASIMIVTENTVAGIGIKPDAEPEFTDLPRTLTNRFVIGSGMPFVKKALLDPSLNAFDLMAIARLVDKFTGGNLTVWMPGKEIQTNVKPIGILRASYNGFVRGVANYIRIKQNKPIILA